MILADLAFYVFAVVLVAAALMVTVSRNPVHSVLWLILSFLCGSGLMILLGAEFIAMILLMVYIGAVAVLFVFVVMMLDIDFAALKGELARTAPLGLLIGVVLIMEIVLGVGEWKAAPDAASRMAAPMAEGVENTRALGLLLYDRYLYLFEAAGLVLLVAMIGAIVLTMRHRTNVRRQNALRQMWRDKATAIELRDVKPGQGL